MHLEPYYRIEAVDPTEAEDALDGQLGTAVALRPGGGGIAPRDLAEALGLTLKLIPVRRRAMLVWRDDRSHGARRRRRHQN